MGILTRCFRKTVRCRGKKAAARAPIGTSEDLPEPLAGRLSWKTQQPRGSGGGREVLDDVSAFANFMRTPGPPVLVGLC